MFQALSDKYMWQFKVLLALKHSIFFSNFLLDTGVIKGVLITMLLLIVASVVALCFVRGRYMNRTDESGKRGLLSLGIIKTLRKKRGNNAGIDETFRKLEWQ